MAIRARDSHRSALSLAPRFRCHTPSVPGRYVKTIGASDLPLPNDPFISDPELLDLVRFPRDQFPRDMHKGDELVYYAVGGYKKIFAIVRLAEDPRRDVPSTSSRTAASEIARRWP